MTSTKCQICNNRTTNPSGLCHLHSEGRLVGDPNNGKLPPLVPKFKPKKVDSEGRRIEMMGTENGSIHPDALQSYTGMLDALDKDQNWVLENAGPGWNRMSLYASSDREPETEVWTAAPDDDSDPSFHSDEALGDRSISFQMVSEPDWYSEVEYPQPNREFGEPPVGKVKLHGGEAIEYIVDVNESEDFDADVATMANWIGSHYR